MLSHPNLTRQWETLRLELSIRLAQMGVESGCIRGGSELEFAALAVCRPVAYSR